MFVCVGLCRVGVYIPIHIYILTFIHAYVQGVQLKANPNRSSSATGDVARRVVNIVEQTTLIAA